VSDKLDPAGEAMIRRIEEMMTKTSEGMVRIPDNCFALIRLPVSIPDFSAFARVAEKMSPRCVTSQSGPFLLIMHAEKKEGA